MAWKSGFGWLGCFLLCAPPCLATPQRSVLPPVSVEHDATEPPMESSLGRHQLRMIPGPPRREAEQIEHDEASAMVSSGLILGTFVVTALSFATMVFVATYVPPCPSSLGCIRAP